MPAGGNPHAGHRPRRTGIGTRRVDGLGGRRTAVYPGGARYEYRSRRDIARAGGDARIGRGGEPGRSTAGAEPAGGPAVRRPRPRYRDIIETRNVRTGYRCPMCNRRCGKYRRLGGASSAPAARRSLRGRTRNGRNGLCLRCRDRILLRPPAPIRRPTPTVVVAGDGAFYMHGMEVHTAIEYGLPITFVVLDNSAHAMCVTREQLFYGDGTASTDSTRRISAPASRRCSPDCRPSHRAPARSSPPSGLPGNPGTVLRLDRLRCRRDTAVHSLPVAPLPGRNT